MSRKARFDVRFDVSFQGYGHSFRHINRRTQRSKPFEADVPENAAPRTRPAICLDRLSRLIQTESDQNLAFSHLSLYTPSKKVLGRISLAFPTQPDKSSRVHRDHRGQAVWKRPTEFDPEHFLKAHREKVVRGQDFDLTPFGPGRRACPAISLALQQTLARLLHSFDIWFALLGSTIDIAEGVGLTMPKAIPLEAHIKPRLPPNLY
eukprot:Gb_03444 [translate_table: standard]